MDDSKDMTPEPEEQPEAVAPEPEAPQEGERQVRKPDVDARTLLEQHVQKSKMQRKASVRAGISIGVILVLAFAGWKIIPTIVNSDPGVFNSAGYVLAVRQEGEQSRVVLITPDKKEIFAPDHVEGTSEESPVWSADGQRIYFVSDRVNNEPHVYRWNPNPGKLLGLFSRPAIERRSTDSQAKTDLSFDVPGGSSKTALMVSGGRVLEFDPEKGETKQVLPPPRMESGAGDPSAGEGAFNALYAKFGSNFIKARWLPNKNYIAATMRAEDGGQILVLQNMVGEKAPPEVCPLMGDTVDFDINPSSGELIATIQACRFTDPASITDEQVRAGIKPPFRHGIIRWPSKPDQEPVIQGRPDDRESFGVPRISPDGNGLLVTVGPYIAKDKRQDTKAAYLLNLTQPQGGQGIGLVQGMVTDMSWHPASSGILFTIRARDVSRIGLMTLNGSTKDVITPAGISYFMPRYSPQTH